MKKGNGINSWGEFLCSFCLQLVERTLSSGKIAKSCGCKQSELISIANNGINNPMYNRFGNEHPAFGYKHEDQFKKFMSELFSGNGNPMYGKFGVLSPTWNGGTSFKEYPIEFKQIRKSILNRDNYICQNLNCEHKSIKLEVHHIDYNKQNNIPKNLITLCIDCHSVTKRKKDRQNIINYYQNIIKELYD